MSIDTTRTNPTVVVGQLLTYAAYAAGTDTVLHAQSTNTLTDMDATNAVVTFVTPASGKVSIDASVLHSNALTTGDAYWGLRESTTTIAETFMTNPVATTAFAYRMSSTFQLSGLTPGSSHTYKLAHRVSSGTVNAYTGPTYGQLVIRVWDAGVLSSWVNSVSYPGRVVQEVNTVTGAVATGTTVMPFDDTIPQNTEGDQYMSLAITPTSATNKLKIEVVFLGSNATADRRISVALFQDSTANALAAGTDYGELGTEVRTTTFVHYMVAGTTSSTTFKVRAGGHAAGTTTFNGTGGGRIFGGVMASSITITEIIP